MRLAFPRRFRPWRRSVAAFWLFPALVLGLYARPAGAQVGAPRPLQLKVLEFNIEYGGVHVSFDKVVEAIRRSRADVVAIEEAQGHTLALQRALGWPYASGRLQILSKYPLIDPPGADGVYLFVQLAPGQVVAIENIHLPSNPYGPFEVKQGETKRSVLELERRLRLPAIQPSLQAAEGLGAEGIPVFLTGDFNAPSWRDWTPEMVGERFQIHYAVKWPVSVAVEEAGFVDSYRQVYPSPKRRPGLTWWAARPHLPFWNPGKYAPQDRIDIIYALGEAKATAAEVIGEAGAPVDLSVTPWPSDHRATASTFTVTPGAPPVMVAADERLVAIGDDVHVTFHSPGTGGEHVAIVPADGHPASGAIADKSTGAGDPIDGTLAFPTDGWTPGAYEAVLVRGGGQELSRIPFWVKKPGTEPSISTGKDTYAVGEPIDVSWENARGERWDWIGLYKRGRDPRIAYYLLWTYTGSTVAGSTLIDESVHGPWPLNAGKYSVYLLRDDGYRKEAGADFAISG
ncbi:MAG TPA: endonuclease/exonuclease/phosphatase family protein [Actinomycetota bacterium]